MDGLLVWRAFRPPSVRDAVTPGMRPRSIADAGPHGPYAGHEVQRSFHVGFERLDRLYLGETVHAMPNLSEMLSKARRAVLRRGVSEADADELVQEAFLRVEQYERAHRARSREALLVRTAVNLSIDHARRRARAPFVEQDNVHRIADRAQPDPAQVAEEQARLRHASAGLQALPERTRRILLMRRLDELSYAEIARREQMSVAAVEKQVARATLQLMRWMEGW
ncbi:MAG: RNA polymerase sigma factor [Sphingomonas sp.]